MYTAACQLNVLYITVDLHLKLQCQLTLAACRTVAVRIAPSLQFTYVEQKVMPLYLLFFRPEQAPSMLAPAMTLRELRDRMSGDSQLPPLVYPGGEHYYMQSPLWPSIMPDVDMQGAPFSCLLRPGKHDACHALLKSLSIRQIPKAGVS